MSHVTQLTLQIKDLDALREAVKALGGELRLGQQEFRWYGIHVGDYPLPAGFTKDDMGRCEHVIHFDGAAYEIGVVKRRDGKPGYALLWDFWAGGFGLKRICGDNLQALTQGYSEAVATKHLKQKGYSLSRTVNADGKIVLRATKVR